MLKKIAFVDSRETSCIANNKLVTVLLDLFDEEFKGEEKYFSKIGSVDKFVDFSFQVSYLPAIDSKIHKLDEVKLVSDALRTAKHCRVIDDKVYREMNRIALYNKGEHIIAYNKEPLLKIVRQDNDWAQNPMIFAFYGSEGVFKHAPDFDSEPYRISIELQTEKPTKEDLLIRMYDYMQKYYEKKGLEIMTETIDETKV